MNDTGTGDTFAERLAAVQARVAAACERAGRAPEEVRILPVGKTHGPEAIAEAFEAGVTCIGENRVQEARQKAALCPSGIEWHLIGHLQSNKVRPAVDLFGMMHAVDSLRLAQRIDAVCGELGKTMPVCLQVNVSGEASKFGMSPEDVPEVLAGAAGLMNLDVVGLMTIPPFTPESDDARPFFRRLRELRDRCASEAGVLLPELSMGMSHDFEAAVEEGATVIRPGTVLFGRRGGKRGGA